MVEYTGKKVTIMACSDCNIKCKHCYISYTGNFNPGKLMDIVSKLSDRYVVTLNGAELLTNLEYLDVLKYLNQTSFISNGLRVCDSDVLQKLKDSNIDCVAMSMHYGIQEELSPVSQTLIESNVRTLRDNGIKSKIFVTITKKNYLLIEEICDYVKSIGVSGVWFTNYIMQGRGANLDNNVLTDEEKKKFFEQLSKVRAKYSKEELCIERCGSFGPDLFRSNSRFECTAIKDFVIMTPDLNIYPCFFLAKPGNEIGFYSDGKIMLFEDYQKIWDGCLTTSICNENKLEIKNHQLIRK